MFCVLLDYACRNVQPLWASGLLYWMVGIGVRIVAEQAIIVFCEVQYMTKIVLCGIQFSLNFVFWKIQFIFVGN